MATHTEGSVDERRMQERPREELVEAVELLEGECRRLARSLDQARFLAHANKSLSASLDYRETLSAIAQCAVPALAGTCFVDILEDREQLKREEVAFATSDEHVGPDHATMLWPVPDEKSLPMQALRNGRPLLVHAEDLPSGPPGERGKSCPPVDTNAMCVPLTSRSRTFGVLTLLSCENDRRYDESDLEVAAELARQGANALFNARLYEVSRNSIRAREDVLAMVSHDLRAPLQTLKLAAVALAKLGAPSGGQRQIDAILRGIHRMERMVSDLLDLTSIEAGHLSVDRQGHEIYGLIRDAFEMLWPLARAKSIDLRIEVMSPPRSVLCDRERVLQVFSNLVGNAIKFTPEGGTVLIRAELQKNQACFAVRDTGPGIPEALRLHLFERYWQAQHGAEKTSGRGLGLYIAKGIVEAQGGHIWFDSEIGSGTTFYFTLPLLPEDLGGDDTEASRGPSSEPLRAGVLHPPSKHAPARRDSAAE